MAWFAARGIKLQCQTWQTWLPQGFTGKVCKWAQQYMEKLWFEVCKEEKQRGKWDRCKQGWHRRAQYVMRDDSHRKFLPPINPKVKTTHVKEQQKQNMFICNYFSKYKITDSLKQTYTFNSTTYLRMVFWFFGFFFLLLLFLSVQIYTLIPSAFPN